MASICKSLKNGKACGHDSITYECLKYGGYYLFKELTYLFNSMLKHLYIPSRLKHNVIVPIYKGKRKPQNDKNSYRGISLSPCLNKVFEKIILLRLM